MKNFLNKIFGEITTEKVLVIQWHLAHIAMTLLLFGIPAMILWHIFGSVTYLFISSATIFLFFVISEYTQGLSLDTITDLNQYAFCWVIPFYIWNHYIGYGVLALLLIIYYLTIDWSNP